jgi:repressor LexA
MAFLSEGQGRGMIEAHILNGDLMLIRPQPTAENGEIVVALIDNAATLKRFYHQGDHIRFQLFGSTLDSECPANGIMPCQ